ncbi:MAG: M15 family metallopeptidase [Candidatus Paceibacterota bacterium]
MEKKIEINKGEKKFSSDHLDYIVLILILFAVIGFLGFRYYLLETELKDTRRGFNFVVNTFDNKTKDLENQLNNSELEKENLSELLNIEQSRNQEFQEQINQITGTLGNIERINEIGEEILQKYSRVYFLNEHYTPSDLSDIPEKHLYDESREQRIHSEVLPFLLEMITAADNDGVKLYINSAYRDYTHQGDLNNRYTFIYGSGTANQFSAEQGYSEHQLGTTIDFTTTGINGALDGFEATQAYQWLLDNAYKYGFILSYPEGNSYYQFEPWHWRFVGAELATELHGDSIYFYDLEQRRINEYLLNIFDK